MRTAIVLDVQLAWTGGIGGVLLISAWAIWEWCERNPQLADVVIAAGRGPVASNSSGAAAFAVLGALFLLWTILTIFGIVPLLPKEK